jgi:hypothetical protein
MSSGFFVDLRQLFDGDATDASIIPGNECVRLAQHPSIFICVVEWNLLG